MKKDKKRIRKRAGGISFFAALITAVFLLFLLWPRIFHEAQKLSHPLKYYETVMKYSKEFEVSPELVFAVIKCESGFNDRAVSKAGAKGLMQITDSTATWIALKLGEKDYDIWNADTNIRFGVWLLSYNLKDFGKNEAIAAYNAGRERVKEWLSDKALSKDGVTLDAIPYPETENYVKKVQKSADNYKKLYFS